MKVLIAYPPLPSEKGSPMLSQNRQFQWFSEPSYLYPCVPAYAASLLKSQGHDVLWIDAIAERVGVADFERRLADFAPDVVAMETKSPVVRRHWKIAERVHALVPRARVVLFGDHVAGNPDETMAECAAVDFALLGGDVDFLLESIVGHLAHGTALTAGIVHRTSADGWQSTGPAQRIGDLDALPFLDRGLTKAHLYFEKWKKRVPFHWTMAGRDCPYGRCTFCSWTVSWPSFRVQSPTRLCDEMDHAITRYGAREIFDDTGTLPGGNWLTRLCEEMIARKIHEKVIFDCNFRFDYFTTRNAALMKRAGFRKLILGIESASERTIDILDKGLKREQIVEGCRIATEAGLQPHLTLMVGYPWETREDAYSTLRLARHLLHNGLAHHLQATVVVPYPGTPLWALCEKNGWIRFDPKDYERYDMTEPVCELIDMDEREVVRMAGQFYKLYLHPKFLAHQLLSVRSLEDLDYAARGVRAIWGHMRDFQEVRRDES
jgi:anaerobic magnesium-protoporphyrin IX monomethyl ester cyclase